MIGYGTRKNYFEIPTFLPIDGGKSRVGKFKVILYLAVTNFPALEVPFFKIQNAGNLKICFLVPYPIIYR